MTPPPRRRGQPEVSFVDLLGQAAAGDEAAFARLFDETVPQVFGLVLRVVRDPAVAEQVTRQVFVEAWRQAGSYDESTGTALCWLLSAAHRCAVDHVRRGEDVPTSTGAAVPPPAPDSADAARVRTALTELEPAQREVVELVWFGGYTHSEAGALVGTAPGEAALLLRDALRRLRALVPVA